MASSCESSCIFLMSASLLIPYSCSSPDLAAVSLSRTDSSLVALSFIQIQIAPRLVWRTEDRQSVNLHSCGRATSCLQRGHTFSFASHPTTHSLWKLCLQGGSCVTVSPFYIAQKHTVHWSSVPSASCMAGSWASCCGVSPLLTLPIFSSSSRSSS